MSGAVRRRMRGAAAVAVAALLLAACGTTPSSEPAGGGPIDAFARTNGLSALPRARVTVGADARTLVVEALVADTASARARGLQGVAEVPDGVGMLFAFDGPAGAEGRPGFWMLDTLVPLDIAFAADGAVVGIATMTPCTARPCPVTHPGVPYDLALEVAAGTLRDAGIAVGDPFVHRLDAAG